MLMFKLTKKFDYFEDYFFLTKANECDIIIKLSHESESQGNERTEERSGKTEREFGS